LRRWKPRPVSPELRREIFGQPSLARGAARTISDLSRWLVPAFGCFILVIGGLTQRLPDRTLAHETNLWAVSHHGNSRIMFSESRRHSEINAVPVKRFEYRLAATQITEPASALLISYTNQLIQ